MKYILSIITALLIALPSQAAVMQGRDGIWYGNICMNQQGWAFVQWQPIGSMCMINGMYGVIINR